MMDDRGWFWRWWTDDGPLPHGGCWWPEEQWALGDYLLLNQNTAMLWFNINISCSWNAGSGAKVWFGWLGWITKVVPSCFSETNSNVFAANLHLFHQQEKMQWVPFLAISSFKSLGSSNWSPVFNKYKNANSNTNTKMQGGLLLAISSLKNLGSCDWSPVLDKLHLTLSLHQPQTWTKWGSVKVNGCYITWTCLFLLKERRCTFMYKYS